MSKNQINDRLWCDEILCSFVILCANFCIELSALCRILKTLQRHISARLAAGWIQRTNAPSGRCCLAGHSVLELWGINYFNVWLWAITMGRNGPDSVHGYHVLTTFCSTSVKSIFFVIFCILLYTFWFIQRPLCLFEITYCNVFAIWYV